MTFRYRTAVLPLPGGTSPADEEAQMSRASATAPCPPMGLSPRAPPRRQPKSRVPTRAALPAAALVALILGTALWLAPDGKNRLLVALAGARRSHSWQTPRPIMDRYLRAMEDPTEYADSDFSFTAEIQAALRSHQHPANCRDASFLVYYVYVAAN